MRDVEKTILKNNYRNPAVKIPLNSKVCCPTKIKSELFLFLVSLAPQPEKNQSRSGAIHIQLGTNSGKSEK